MSQASDIVTAIDAGDLDGLVHLVDGLCSHRDWPTVVEVRDRCRHTLEERGLQLWPAAEYAEYRLALEAPGRFAGPVVVDDAGRFALGPLWEVAASTHQWDELREWIPPGPARSLTANERVLRGEDLDGDDTVDRDLLEIPLVLASRESRYLPATYHPDRAEFPRPDPPVLAVIDLPEPGMVAIDPPAVEALIEVAARWRDQSNGTVAATVVDGSALAAIAALGHREVLAAEVDGADALALLAWAAASGGAYGRRPGGAMGRFAAWWSVAAIAGLEWPPTAEQLDEAVAALRWWWWEPQGPHRGWSACLAVEDPERDRAWVLQAGDDRRDDDPLRVGEATV